MTLRTIIVVVLLQFPNLVHAGNVSKSEVYIDDFWTSAQGVFASARNSADNTQYILCAKSVATSGYVKLDCYARNSQGVLRTCTTTSPQMLEAWSSVTATSYLRFAWNPNGECISLLVASGSPYGVKTN